MYTTCLFCSGDLGRNEAVEHFPVGRRLAFDAAKGRLWVVCRKCERWNLTPLEERWEAIEECERAFGATRLRMSTDHIGLARLKEGLELVRIGAPQRPEMAAWRYGDQFGRRRRKQYFIGGGVVALAGVVVVAGPVMGLIGAGAFSPVLNLLNLGKTIYQNRTLISLPNTSGERLTTRLVDIGRVELNVQLNGAFELNVPVVTNAIRARWRRALGTQMHTLAGDDAVRAASALLPMLNRSGGSASDVRSAVELIENSATPNQLFREAADELLWMKKSHFASDSTFALKRLPIATRLALEMASHEDSERRALEGELHILEAAWRQADEIAAIADDMFLPRSVESDLARLKRTSTDSSEPAA